MTKGQQAYVYWVRRFVFFRGLPPYAPGASLQASGPSQLAASSPLGVLQHLAAELSL